MSRKLNIELRSIIPFVGVGHVMQTEYRVMHGHEILVFENLCNWGVVCRDLKNGVGLTNLSSEIDRVMQTKNRVGHLTQDDTHKA